MEERRVLEHPEGPFIGMGHERDPYMRQDGRTSISDPRERRSGNSLGLHNAAARNALVKERCGAQPPPIRQRLGAAGAGDLLTRVAHGAVAVAIGTRLKEPAPGRIFMA